MLSNIPRVLLVTEHFSPGAMGSWPLPWPSLFCHQLTAQLDAAPTTAQLQSVSAGGVQRSAGALTHTQKAGEGAEVKGSKVRDHNTGHSSYSWLTCSSLPGEVKWHTWYDRGCEAEARLDQNKDSKYTPLLRTLVFSQMHDHDHGYKTTRMVIMSFSRGHIRLSLLEQSSQPYRGSLSLLLSLPPTPTQH